MMRWLLIGVLAFTGWMYFTESGKAFYRERLWPMMETRLDPGVEAEARRLQGRLGELERRLAPLRDQLRWEKDIQAKKSGSLRTDIDFLQRSIERWEQERATVSAELERLRW